MDDRSLFEKHGHVLTAKQREAFELAMRGLSQRAIALALNLPRSAVVDRLEGARRRLLNAHREAA